LSVRLLQHRFERRQVRRLKRPSPLDFGALQAALQSRFSACINIYIRVPIPRTVCAADGGRGSNISLLSGLRRSDRAACEEGRRDDIGKEGLESVC
jgi:hypothetical protein